MYEGFSDTHVDQSKVVLIDGELLRADVFLQSRGIGALKDNTHQTLTWGFSSGTSTTTSESTGFFIKSMMDRNILEDVFGSELEMKPKLQANYSLIDEIILLAKRQRIGLHTIAA